MNGRLLGCCVILCAVCFDAHQSSKNDYVNRQEGKLEAPKCDDPPLLPGLMLNKRVHLELSYPHKHTHTKRISVFPTTKVEIRMKALSGSDGTFIRRKSSDAHVYVVEVIRSRDRKVRNAASPRSTGLPNKFSLCICEE